MRLFCRADHSEPKPEEEPRDLRKELLEAKARLAKLKKLPESSFAEKTSKVWKPTPYGGPVSYSVDNKVDAIAKQEAMIAELEVLLSD